MGARYTRQPRAVNTIVRTMSSNNMSRLIGKFGGCRVSVFGEGIHPNHVLRLQASFIGVVAQQVS